ncbi:MAG: carbamate kinase [Acidobacteria bacterium]|nr:carbamate kinase [Acidobacteriota bacterium]
MKRIVIAFGGNAILQKGQEGTVYEQFANTRTAIDHVMGLIREGHEVVITHGNGPQVGNMMMRVDKSRGFAYDLPLGVCVADTQGEMGYMIAQSLQNRLIREKIERPVVAVVTQVVVDRNDPSVLHPTKPVGRFYSEAEAQEMHKQGKHMVEDAGRGWRHVVPSPIPRRVVESPIIRQLIDLGAIVIACGGGGMPVYIEDDGTFEGIDGVVDKDRASSVLAREIEADELIVLTEVDKVALNYNKPDQVDLDTLNLAQARAYLAEGHFHKGSMGPKVEAVCDFLEGGGKRAVIASLDKAYDALHGRAGTHFTRE